MIDFNTFYINQADPDVGSITFKNNTTLRSYGCGVTSFSMILCQKNNIQQREKQLQVIKEVLNKATNADGNLVYGLISNIITNDKKYICKTITEDMIKNNIEKGNAVVAHVPGHFVVVNGIDNSKNGFESFLVKDPGKRKNINLQQVLNDYKSKVVKAYYVLENI